MLRVIGTLLGEAVRPQDIADGTTIRDNETLEAPLISQQTLQQLGASTAGLAVHSIVGAHHACCSRSNACLEGRCIRGFHVPAKRLCAFAMHF